MKKSFILRIIHGVKKLTALDYVICIVLLGLFGFFMINRASKEEHWVNIILKVSHDEWWWNANAPESWYGLGLAKGQSAYNTFGKRVAEIESIDNMDVGGPSRLIFIQIKLLTTYDKKTHTYTFNYQPLQIGKGLDLTFNTYNVHGLVTHVGSDAIPYTMRPIEVKLFTIRPWEANSYKEGLLKKDMGGNIIATVDHVDVTNTTISELIDNSGRLILLPAPNDLRKDVTLRMTVKSYLVDGVPHFVDGTALKIGNNIWVEFAQVAVKGAIISNVY